MDKYRNNGFWFVVIMFLIVFVSYNINQYYLKSELEKSSKYTIGQIKEINKFAHSQTLVVINFLYKKKEFSIKVGLGVEIKDSYKVNDRIFIQFSPKNPDEYFLCFDVPKVPNNLKAPENGWDHMPIKKP